MNLETCRSWAFIAVGALTLGALAACSNQDSEASAAAQRPAIPVSVAQARRQEIRVELYSVGRLVSRNTPQLAAEIDARVVAIGVDEGQPVAPGQELIRLDTTALVLARREATAAIQQLRASIDNEERRVARYRDLQSREVMPQERLDDAEAQLAVYRASMEAAEARLAIIDDRLAKARLLAPVGGVVERRHVSVGDFVRIGTPLLTLSDTQALRAELPFPETVGAQLRVGQSLYLRCALAPKLEIEARIGMIRPQVGATSRSLVAIADVDNPGPWRPEATIEAVAVTEVHPQAVVVPVLSVVQRPAGEVVYLLQDAAGQSTVRQQIVEPGVRQDGWIEIRSGIEAGMQVAVEGAHYLSDGAQVTVTEQTP